MIWRCRAVDDPLHVFQNSTGQSDVNVECEHTGALVLYLGSGICHFSHPLTETNSNLPLQTPSEVQLSSGHADTDVHKDTLDSNLAGKYHQGSQDPSSDNVP